MFSSFSLPFSQTLFGSGGSRKPLSLNPVKPHDIETASDKRTRRLQSLLKLNHANHAVIYNHLQFHNHAPHILGSACILGAEPAHLNTIYDSETKSLEPWRDSPGEISKDDWRDYLGKRDYQRAYLDFFEDQLVDFGYDWKKMLEHYLLDGKEPLINSMVSGLGHPLIHLGYAYELNSRTVAMEALTLGTCFYDSLHKYIDTPSYTRPSSYKAPFPLSILHNISQDQRFSGLFTHQGSDNIALLLEKREDVVLDHWNAWDVDESNLHGRFHAAQKAAVALLVATKTDGKQYDFFLCHILTSSHALRVLLPVLPAKYHVPLVRQWFLFAILAYIAQLRPKIDESFIEDFVPKEGKDSWEYVRHMALKGEYATDAHWVKGLRAMMVAEEGWGGEGGWWLKAACRLAGGFGGWGGFDGRTEGYKAY